MTAIPFTAPLERDTAADAQRLVQRMDHFRALEPLNKSRDVFANAGSADFDMSEGLPAIDADQLSASALRAAMHSHGALIVRNLLPDTQVQQALRDMIDGVVDISIGKVLEKKKPSVGPFYNPPEDLASYSSDRNIAIIRKFLAEAGSAMCSESPSVAEALFELYDSMGLRPVIEEYLGEAPCVSAKKWVLRRTALPIHEAGWHQDGAFMGTDIKSLNMWISLTDCGADRDAPGMDIVPGRLDKIVPADGAVFEWASGPDLVANELGGNAYASPRFDSGDAIFFDHYNLHRSQFREDFTRQRYALETWFFGEESFPKNQIPIAW